MPKGSGSAPARGRRGRGHAALTPPDGAEAEGGSDSSDGGDGGDASGSESGEECEAAVTLESLLAPLSLDEFCRDYWGQKPYATRVERGVLDQLRARFLEGEFGDVAAACRNDDNARCGVRRARAAARRTPHAARHTPHATRRTPHAARCTLHARLPPQQGRRVFAGTLPRRSPTCRHRWRVHGEPCVCPFVSRPGPLTSSVRSSTAWALAAMATTLK